MPYSTKEIPPTMAAGIESISAANLGEKENRMAKYAAIRMTLGSYTLDSASTPVFSP